MESRLDRSFRVFTSFKGFFQGCCRNSFKGLGLRVEGLGFWGFRHVVSWRFGI